LWEKETPPSQNPVHDKKEMKPLLGKSKRKDIVGET
jgi:hypothetical protein